MALKFRRGTTAQQSGSLAFGEPYVNTTLGTLLIGGPDGDIVLSTTGTGSTGNFGPISGSGLDITGNANIHGNLILGGTITIGDANTDNVVVNADLSSSIIPNDDNSFDLGSSSKRYRAVYANDFYGAINATNGLISGSSQLPTLATTGSNTFVGNQTIIGSGAGFAAYISTSVNDATLGLDTTANINALYFLKNGEKNFEISYDTTNANPIFRLLPYDNSSLFQIGNPSNSGADYVFISETTYGNVLIGPGIGNGVTEVGGAIPLTDKVQIKGNLYVSGSIRANSFTGSIAATNGLISGSSQVVGILSSLNAYTASNDTTNELQSTRIDQLAAATASVNSFTSSINTTIKNKLDVEGVISGSSQVTLSSTNGFSTFSSSVDSRILTEKGRVDAILLAADADKDSFAEIVTLINSVDLTNDNAFASFYTASVGRLNNLESTSASVNISVSNLNSFTSSINTTIKNKLNTDGVISGSSQVSYVGLSNIPAGIVSGSSQIDVASTTGDIALGTRTSGNYVASLVAGTNITLSNNSGEGATPTIGLTNNAITIAGTSTSLGGSITLATITDGSGIVSGSSQITPLLPTGTISGSSQVFANVSGDITIASNGVATIAANSVALGTDTTGNYMADVSAGTGVTVTHTPGEGSTATIAIGQAVGTGNSPTFAGLTINGAITATGDITAYYSSDKRYKNNIQPIENALAKVRTLNGVTWEWNDDVNEVTKAAPKTGLIAQEVQAVLPEVVKEKEDGYLGLDYAKMMGLMVEAIKEQQIQIEKLQLEVTDLKKQKGL